LVKKATKLKKDTAQKNKNQRDTKDKEDNRGYEK
jgi:hypothetical protein